jgi:hypothetical protein
LSFLAKPGGQSLRPLVEGDAPMVVAGLDAEALGLLAPSTLMLVVLELVAVLPAVLPLPLVEPLLAVLPLGDVVMLPEAVVPLAPVDGAVAVLPDLVPRCRVVSPEVPPRFVVVVSDPLVLAAALDWLLKLPLDDEVCAYAPATNKDAIKVASSLLMSTPFQME